MSEKVELARHEWVTVAIFCMMFAGLVSVTYEPFIELPEVEIEEVNDTRKIEKKARKPRKTKMMKKSFEKNGKL
jgi:hypothetical protein